MTKSHVYFHRPADSVRIGLPLTADVKAAMRKAAEGTHLPFQRRNPDRSIDYILVRKTERVTRFLRAVNKGVFA